MCKEQSLFIQIFFIFRKKMADIFNNQVFVSISQTHWSISGSLTLFNMLSYAHTHTHTHTHTRSISGCCCWFEIQ